MERVRVTKRRRRAPSSAARRRELKHRAMVFGTYAVALLLSAIVAYLMVRRPESRPVQNQDIGNIGG